MANFREFLEEKTIFNEHPVHKKKLIYFAYAAGFCGLLTQIEKDLPMNFSVVSQVSRLLTNLYVPYLIILSLYTYIIHYDI